MARKAAPAARLSLATSHTAAEGSPHALSLLSRAAVVVSHPQHPFNPVRRPSVRIANPSMGSTSSLASPKHRARPRPARIRRHSRPVRTSDSLTTHVVHSNPKVSLNEGRGKGCRNRVIIDPREGVPQDVLNRLGRPSIGASSCLRKTLGGSGGKAPFAFSCLRENHV